MCLRVRSLVNASSFSRGQIGVLKLGDFAEGLLRTGGGDGKTFDRDGREGNVFQASNRVPFFIPLLKATSSPLELSMSIDTKENSYITMPAV